jgi:hypothetical protein
MVVGMRSIEVGELGADVLFNARQSRFDGGEKCHGDLKAESPRIGPTVPIVEIRLLDVGRSSLEDLTGFTLPLVSKDFR